MAVSALRTILIIFARSRSSYCRSFCEKEGVEAYTKSQSNQSLKQEEFVTGARLLVEDGRYDPAAKENTTRDTLVFGIASDRVHKDAMALENGLTFKQVYDLVKVDESTKKHK